MLLEDAALWVEVVLGEGLVEVERPGFRGPH
jgi:hypothetical protein